MHPPLYLRFAIHKSIYLFIQFLFGAYHAHTPVLASTLLHILVVFYVIVLYPYWLLVNSYLL